MKKWMNDFGEEYTDRNARTLGEMDEGYRKKFGVSRTELNNLFIGGLARSIKILEVGSNRGHQLLLLQKMGFENLYGVEINNYAVEVCKSRTRNIYINQGSAFNIPFKDEYFDLVFTSGVLIHISPDDIPLVLDEIYRCTKRYIWGYEYYFDKYMMINYRGENNLLWKADFARLFMERHKDLKLIKEEKYTYFDNPENIDAMYLLKKPSQGD